MREVGGADERSDGAAPERDREHQVRGDGHGGEGAVPERGARAGHPGAARHARDQDLQDGAPGRPAPHRQHREHREPQRQGDRRERDQCTFNPPAGW